VSQSGYTFDFNIIGHGPIHGRPQRGAHGAIAPPPPVNF